MSDTPGAAPYVRGTRTHRITTARLTAGMRVLTEALTVDAAGAVKAWPARQKTGSYIRTVAGKTAWQTPGGFRRAGREYVVTFTDGAVSANLAPVQSWDAVTDAPADDATVPAAMPAVQPSAPEGWTDAQHSAIRSLCERYRVPFDPADWFRPFDLPAGWLAGTAGTLYAGVAPDGSVHS